MKFANGYWLERSDYRDWGHPKRSGGRISVKRLGMGIDKTL
ncbi:hypothetical protein [Candidatus Liberibacter sp.]|nr:hypothetical protein [Candidatus Liberibacter sp.]